MLTGFTRGEAGKLAASVYDQTADLSFAASGIWVRADQYADNAIYSAITDGDWHAGIGGVMFSYSGPYRVTYLPVARVFTVEINATGEIVATASRD